MNKKLTLDNPIWKYVAAAILLTAAYAYRLADTNLLYILGDEFGYWADAAWYAGYDWSRVMEYNAYYSFGYSFLLVPLFLIKDFMLRYQMALVIHIFLLLLAAYCLYRLLCELTGHKNDPLAYLASIGASLYFSTVFYMKTTQTETLLYCLFIYISWFLYLAAERKKIGYFLLVGLLSGYSVMVHMRSIAIPFAVAVFLCIYFFENKKSWFKILLTMGIMAGLILLMFVLKKDLQNTLYAVCNNVEVNDVEGQVGQVTRVFSLEGLLLLIRSVAGKCLYLTLASFFVIEWGVFHFFKDTKLRYAIYFALVLLADIGVASIYTISAQTVIDQTVYGRYTEYVIGPFLAMGLYGLFRTEKKYVWYELVFLVIASIVGMYFHYDFAMFDDGIVREANVVGLAYLSYNGEAYLYEGWLLVALRRALLLSLVIYGLCRIQKKNLAVLGIVLAAFIWFTGGTGLMEKQLSLRKWYKGMEVITMALEKEEVREITYLYNDETGGFDYMYADILQYMDPELGIGFAAEEDYDYQTDSYVIVRQGTEGELLKKRGEKLETCNFFTLYHVGK